MWAIQVKFLGPTNTKPSRWRVISGPKSITFSKGTFVDNNVDKDARAAAEEMALRQGWIGLQYGTMIEGTLKNGDRVFVFTGGP